MTEEKKSSTTTGLIALVLGILPVPIFFLSVWIRKESLIYFSLAAAVGAVILGILALTQKEKSRTPAIVGMILGAIFLVLALVIYLYFAFAEPDEFSRGDI